MRSLSNLPFGMEGPQAGVEEEESEEWESEDGYNGDEGSAGLGSEEEDSDE